MSNVVGEYMMCALFNAYLLLAIPTEDGRRFSVIACLHLQDMRVEPADNRKGRNLNLFWANSKGVLTDSCIGLHCHGVPYSWKVIFESNMHLFELVLSACSEREAVQWRDSLRKEADISSYRNSEAVPDMRKYFMTTLELKPLGTMVGQPNNPTRRSSVHGSLTMTMCSEIVHLIIKGTQAPAHPCQGPNAEEPAVSRSQSLMITDRTAILSPKRQERIRLERSLVDVWTRDILPYPGMTLGKGDHLIRTSAGSLMRRLSLHTPFTRRSSSLAATVTVKSIETGYDIKDEDGWEEKEPMEIILPLDGLEHKDGTEDETVPPCSTLPVTPPPPNGVRQRKTKGAHAGIEELSDAAISAAKSERGNYLTKRWSASMILLKTFSTSRRRSWSPRV